MPLTSKVYTFFILCLLTSFSYAQVGYNNSVTINANSQVYDHASERLLNKKQVETVMINRKSLIIPKDFDSAGNPVNYYSITGIDVNGNFDLSPYYKQPDIGDAFPKFRTKTVNNEKTSSKDLKGKIVVINFQLMLRAPFAKIDEIKMVEDYVSSKENMESLIFSISGNEDAVNFVEENKLNSKIVADATNFTRKYGVFKFPTYMLVDREGNFLGSYTKTDELINALDKLN